MLFQKSRTERYRVFSRFRSLLFFSYPRKHKYRDMHRHIPLLKPLFVHTLFRLPSSSLHFSCIKLRSSPRIYTCSSRNNLVNEIHVFWVSSIFFFFFLLYYNDFEMLSKFNDNVTYTWHGDLDRANRIRIRYSIQNVRVFLSFCCSDLSSYNTSVARAEKEVSKRTHVEWKMFLFPWSMCSSSASRCSTPVRSGFSVGA